ncbi:PKD domain-containing protein [Mucilaginibacter kameinonensis]|uniref:PKD domain-containing protein n=1 Tax=Mucilaginibacter kameinonensis TaxID=452286 RepID=UPI000EF840C3|nr:PKD domain-containing protein [Mucilaginibacter kameinonensis]
MKKTVILLFAATLIIACKNEKNIPLPSASFHFGNQTSEDFKLVANDTTSLISAVKGAASISWDFGDGRTSKDDRPVLSYSKAGVYTIMLTATSEDGKKTTPSKKITVLDLVLKNIVIDKVYWNNTDEQFAQAGWPLTNSADLYIKIQRLQGDDVFSGGFAPNATMIYTSPLQKNIYKTSDVPIIINLKSKVVLEKDVLLARNYLISLIAKSNTGEYVLFTNRYSGSNQLVKTDNLTKNDFEVTSSFFSSLNLKFNFE